MWYQTVRYRITPNRHAAVEHVRRNIISYNNNTLYIYFKITSGNKNDFSCVMDIQNVCCF